MSSFQPVRFFELDAVAWLDLVSRYARSGAEESTATLCELASSAPSSGNESLQKVIEAIENLVQGNQFFNSSLLSLAERALSHLRQAAVRSPEYSEFRDPLTTPSPSPSPELEQKVQDFSSQSLA